MPRPRPDGPGGGVRAGLVLLLLATCAGSVEAQKDLPTELKTVAAVKLEGRHSVPAKEIRAVLKTKAPSFLPWRERPVMRRDFLHSDSAAIELVYRQHGFLDCVAHVRLSPSREDSNGTVVTFRIEEGLRARIASVALPEDVAVPPELLRKRIYARVGRPFNPAYLIVDTTRIAQEFQERGYLPHVVGSARRDSAAPTRVHVRYDVRQGPLYRNGAVYLSSPGESKVKEFLARRELVIKPDEVYRLSRLQRSVERLYETGLFSQVQMTPLVDSTNTRIDYDLRLRERKQRWIDAGVGSGTAERLRFTGEWGHRNLLGRGLEGVLSSRLALDGRARFLLGRAETSLLEPWLFRTRTRGQVLPYYENRHDRANPTRLLKQEAKGVSFSVRHDFGRFARGTLTQDNSYVTQSEELLAPELDSLAASPDTFPPSYSTHRIQAAIDRDTRDNPLNPLRGSVQQLSGDIAGGRLSGTSNFVKWQVGSAWYTPLPRNWILATRIRGGAMRPFGKLVRFSSDPRVDSVVARIPVEDRFRLGGVNSLRGYNENEIAYDRFGLAGAGGLALFLANAELRIPVVGPFGLEVFVDAGNVWTRAEYLRIENFIPRATGERADPTDLKYVFGIGARVNLPIGPLRIDFTWSPRPDERGIWKVAEPQFAIGPSF